MGCGIYKITNIINQKTYIGSSIEIKVRMMKHKYMLKSNTHYNNHLQNSFNEYGENNFEFEIIEECSLDELIVRENYFINKYKSNDFNSGYNLATVNEFRRNNFNEEVKVKNSKLGLESNGNFTEFKCVNLETNNEIIFNSLVDAANYLLSNNYTKGTARNIRQKLSYCLRGKKVNNGSNGSIRITAYKHKWLITNK